LTAESLDKTSSNYVKGVFISKFDLSFGPKPITRYPADFIAEAHANELAMQSMVQLNSSKGKTVDIVLTVDDIEAIGFGTLGSLPTLGHYSLIVFFDIRAPKPVSDSVDKVLSFFADFNAKLADCPNPDDSFAKQIFGDTCELLNRELELKRARMGNRLHEQDDLIVKIVHALKPVLETDLDTIKAIDIPLAHNLRVLLDRLNQVATSLNLPDSVTILRDLLFEMDIREETP
jgi:hypothetical protein